MKFAVKITLLDGTETMCAVVHADNSESVQTWDDSGHAEAQALKIRDHSPRGTLTKVVAWECKLSPTRLDNPELRIL